MIKRLIIDIHRRSLWQVLAIYAVGSWVALQVAEALTNSAGLPGWVPGFALVLLVIGLPIVLATAFVQEGLPGGDRAGSAERSATDDAPAVNVASGTGSYDVVSTRPPVHHRLFTWRRAILGGVAAFSLLGLAAAGYMSMRVLGIGSPGTLLAQGVLERGAAVLLSDFESASDPELGNVVTKTLRVDLLQSPTIRLLERSDVGEALGRMRIDGTAPVSAEVATQLAEREGYAAVIAGDVAVAGTGYVLTATILAGEGFRPLAAFRETARSDADLVDAIERLSRAIRDKVGESLRSVRGSPSLAQVTTTSLPALRAYTRAEELESSGDQRAALEQYERAAALDTMFAMAYRKIAVTLLNQGVRRTDAVRAATRAWELRDRVPPLERQLATGFYHVHVSGDIGAAVDAFEQAMLIDSTNTAVRLNLSNMYVMQGRNAEAVTLLARSVQERPIAALWGNLAFARHRLGDFDGAQTTLDSAAATLPEWVGADLLKSRLFVDRLNYAAADSLIRVAERRGGTTLDQARRRLSTTLLAGMRGRLRDAERALDAPGAELFMAEPALVNSLRSMFLLLRGDTAGAVRVARAALDDVERRLTTDDFRGLINVLAEARAARPAAELLARWQVEIPTEELGAAGRMERAYVRAKIARMNGDVATALSTLEEVRRACPGCGSHILHELGRTRDEMGQADRALEEYERSLAEPDVSRMWDLLDLPRALRRLAELYDARGDTQKAIEYYARLVELWQDADPELQPQVRAAQRRLEQLMPDR